MKIAIALIAMIVAAVWFGGVRIFVIEPSELLPRQGTVLVYGMHDFPLIDSPAAMCARDGNPSEGCKAGAAVGYLQTASVIAALPYSETLYKFTLKK